MQNNCKEVTSHPLSHRVRTRIGAEILDKERGWIHLCHGYDLYNDLLERYSWSELTFLHLKGELPTRAEADAFDLILRAVINPGPTDCATQAAMTAAVTHTPVGNSLLAGLAVLQGRFNGALAVEKSMQMLQELAHLTSPLNKKSAAAVLEKYPDLPGFTTQHDQMERAGKIISRLKKAAVTDRHLKAALQTARLAEVFLSLQGLFAAVLCDLRFSPRQGHGLYLIAAAPGILAHLLEQMEGDWSSYPFGAPPEYTGPRDRVLSEEQRCYKGHHE